MWHLQYFFRIFLGILHFSCFNMQTIKSHFLEHLSHSKEQLLERQGHETLWQEPDFELFQLGHDLDDDDEEEELLQDLECLLWCLRCFLLRW